MWRKQEHAAFARTVRNIVCALNSELWALYVSVFGQRHGPLTYKESSSLDVVYDSHSARKWCVFHIEMRLARTGLLEGFDG